MQVRIGNRSLHTSCLSLPINSPQDAKTFQQAVVDSIKSNKPEEPLIITINDHCPFLDDILATCIDFHGSSPSAVNRDVQFSESVQLPQTADRKAAQIPWTFIVNHMNLPEVFLWSLNSEVPSEEHASRIDEYRLKVGAWVCDQGAYNADPKIPVIVLFHRSDIISEGIMGTMIFPYIFRAAKLYDDRAADDAVCWVFYQLYNLLTDWQNIIGEIGRKLNQAEVDSHYRRIPVKARTRLLHKEVDRLFELLDYLRFHARAFNKLAKFKTKSTSPHEPDHSIWEVMDDCIEDLSQYENYMQSMVQRLNNLIELDFNLENAAQAADSRFISILGCLFLPVSFLASIFGINSINWAARYYLYSALPLFVVSVFLVWTVPIFVSKRDRRRHPTHIKRIQLHPGDFTLLGEEAPGGDDPVGPHILQMTRASPDRKPTKVRDFADRGSSREPPRASSKDPPRGRQRSGTQTFYGIHRSPGVVGSRRKNLHESTFRGERGRAHDSQRDNDMDPGYGLNLHPAHASDRGWTWPEGQNRRKSAAAAARPYTDGMVDEQSAEGRARVHHWMADDDVEKLGSQRRATRSSHR